MPKCNVCGCEGKPEKFDTSFSAYHDFRCPECGTSDIDTTDINEAWAKDGAEYGYGNDNFLQMK